MLAEYVDMGQSDQALPKVLFVNEYPPDSLSVADLVRQLLLGYPANQLAWWSCRTSAVGGLSDLKAGEVYSCRMPPRLIPGRRLTRFKSRLLESLWVPVAARHLRQTVERVQPDVVWLLMYGWPILVARQAGLKNARHLHVSLWDLPDMASSRKLLGESRSRRFVEAVFQLARQANSCDGISLGVLEAVAARTGRRDALLLHSGFEAEHLRRLETGAVEPADNALRLAYVGSIISEASFLQVLAALDRVRPTLGQPVWLEFFGARGYRNSSWFDPQWMVEHGVFSDRDLVESLRRCSWGITVMDLEGQDLRYSQFSFPNKIGTYLSAGMPILGLGHPTSTLADLMQRYPIGQFTSASERAGLEKFLQGTLQIRQPRSAFRPAILQCARTEFNAQEIRGRLWKAWGMHSPEM